MMRLAIAAATVLLASSVVHAQPASDPDEQKRALARNYYERGLAHYNLAEYQTAIDFFKRAYALLPQPGFLFNLGQSYRLAGDCRNAAKLYRNFLRESPGSPHRALVGKHLKTVELCARELDRQSEQIPPPRPPAWLDFVPPPSAPRAQLLATRGRSPQPSQQRKPQRWLSYGLVGLGVAFGAGGVYLANDAARKSNEISRLFREGGVWTDDFARREASGQRSARLSWIASGVGLALIGAGITLYVRDSRRVDVRPANQGAMVSWSSDF